MDRANEISKLVGQLSNTNTGRIVISLISNGIISAVNNSKSVLPSYTYTENSFIRNKVGQDETKTHIIRGGIKSNIKSPLN